MIANKRRNSEAASFHRAVFKYWGPNCWFCGCKADDAAHIIPRSHLGKRARYCDPKIAVPLCRPCHRRQTDGKLVFNLGLRRMATIVVNEHLKQKIVVPS